MNIATVSSATPLSAACGRFADQDIRKNAVRYPQACGGCHRIRGCAGSRRLGLREGHAARTQTAHGACLGADAGPCGVRPWRGS